MGRSASWIAMCATAIIGFCAQEYRDDQRHSCEDFAKVGIDSAVALSVQRRYARGWDDDAV